MDGFVFKYQDKCVFSLSAWSLVHWSNAAHKWTNLYPPPLPLKIIWSPIQLREKAGQQSKCAPLLSWDQIETGAGFAFSTGLSIMSPTSPVSSILPWKGLSHLSRGRTAPERNKRNPDQFGRVSRLCVMSEAEHPPITASVIIILEASKSEAVRRNRRRGGEERCAEEQAAWVGTLVLVITTACCWKLSVRQGRVWVQRGSCRRSNNSN